MKEIGHSYIAERVLESNDPLIYIGCLIPDLVWYTSARPELADTDLHEEGSVVFYHYVKKNHPTMLPLARAVLVHGTRYGADRYNDLSYKNGPGFAYRYSQPLEEEVARCCGISAEIAKVRAHNFIELGLDLLLGKEHPGLVTRIETSLFNADFQLIARIVSECFEKQYALVKQGFDEFLACYRPGDLSSAHGLAKIWARQSAGLPEKDTVDIPLATKIIERAATLIRNDYEAFLKYVVKNVKQNVRSFRR